MEKQQTKRRVSVDDFLPPGDNSLNRNAQQEEVEAPQPKRKMGGGMPQSPKKQQPQQRPQRPQQPQQQQPQREPLTPRGPKKKSKVKTVLGVIVVLGVCVGGGFFGLKLFNQYIKPNMETSQEQGGQNNNGQSVDVNQDEPNLTPGGDKGALTPGGGDEGSLTPGDDNSKPGLTDLENDSTMTNGADVEKDTMVTDLRGISVIPNYTVQSIETVTDMVNYEKHRAITADGMELLWLEVDYKQKEYKVTVPFKIFKELDSTGITVVNMEVLNLANGSQIISHMEVREDYKSKLEQGLR